MINTLPQNIEFGMGCGQNIEFGMGCGSRYKTLKLTK